MRRYRDLTNRQTEVLCQIGAGNPLPRTPQSIFDTLEAKGLIHRTEDVRVSEDVFGYVTIPQYEMPISEHIAWCDWCSTLEEAT